MKLNSLSFFRGAVFLVLSFLTTPFSFADRAQLEAFSLSINLSKGTGTLGGNNLEVYFTTYDGSSGLPLYDNVGGFLVVSGELSPNPNQTGGYKTDYVLFQNGIASEAGTGTAIFPTTDSNGNQVPDFLEIGRNGTVSFSGTVTGEQPTLSKTANLTGQISRSAGASAGSYVVNVQNPTVGTITYHGSTFLVNAAGSIDYNRSTQNCEVTATLYEEDGTSVVFTGNSSFFVNDANTVSFPATRFVGSNARFIQSKPYTLTRNGNRYLGTVEFEDGGLSTSWRDFIYWKMVITDFNDSNGNGIPNLTDVVAVGPTVTQNPVSASVNAGDNVLFDVAASGTAPLSYQWRKNGVNISGANTSKYQITGVQLSDGGSYSVVVSNSAGQTESNAASLTVSVAAIAPSITSGPNDLSVQIGQRVEFNVVVNGSAPLIFQWNKDSISIPTSTNSSLVISSAQLSDAGIYSVIVRNSAGQANSRLARLSVIQSTTAPSISNQPEPINLFEGQTAIFSVAASGTAPLSYQWQRDHLNIPGANGAVYQIDSVAVSDSGSYSVLVSNIAGSVSSQSVPLSISKSPAAGLVSFTIDAGKSLFTLSGASSGGNISPQLGLGLLGGVKGNVVVELNAASIRFDSASLFSFQESVSYSPGVGGSGVSAPAAFGFTAPIRVGRNNASAAAALRKLGFGLSAAPIPIVNGTFLGGTIAFTLSPGVNLDFQMSGALIRSGFTPLSGTMINSPNDSASISTIGTTQTIRIPVNLSLLTTINGTGDTGLQLSGIIYGYRSIDSGNPPQITFQQSPVDRRSIVLSWPQGFKLQRSVFLLGGSWIDYAQESPTNITTVDTQGYFRTVPK